MSPLPRRARALVGASLAAGLCAAVGAVIFEMSLEDFHVPGTQVGDVDEQIFISAQNCAFCHGSFDPENEPSGTWAGSKMAFAGRNPLFFAQMALANQDVENVGYYCMRCHVPMAVPTGSAIVADGTALHGLDFEGVNCHFCHSMVDPIYKPGVSPSEDEAILAALADVPAHYGNAMFVLDPEGRRRGARPDPIPAHEFIHSPFHASSHLCGTCHDVGNVATTRQPDGTYAYNALDERSPTQDPHEMFPLERTFTEWSLSAFAQGGVDMGGRFGGEGVTVVSTCQDCHMPRAAAQICVFGPEHEDARRHEFAGAGAQVLDLIAAHLADDPEVDFAAIAQARAASVSMLQRAASLKAVRVADRLVVRVVNESGHKLPTGHIEGRRVWVNVRFHDARGRVIDEIGGYDVATAELDEHGAALFEMRVGLSEAASGLTGLPAGPTAHMALADTIAKDTRIPPRGWDNEAFAAGGAPAVGIEYADGQHWHDSSYRIPPGATRASVRLHYQNTPRWYIEHLRDHNHTDAWGQRVHDLWMQTGRGEPITMATASVDLRRRPGGGTGSSSR